MRINSQLYNGLNEQGVQKHVPKSSSIELKVDTSAYKKHGVFRVDQNTDRQATLN